MKPTPQSDGAQIDVAEVVGAVARPLPQIQTFAAFAGEAHDCPAQLIHGVLYEGCKALLTAPSKARKSWVLLDAAMSVASGQPWLGFATTKSRVLVMNFELQHWVMAFRLNSICQARPEIKGIGENLLLWNLRGHACDITLLRPKIEDLIREKQVKLIIFEPMYSMLGGRDENDNSHVSSLLSEMEQISQATGASIIMCHHFAKGDPGSKEAQDRGSGAGAWSREPDSLVVLTPHEEENCYTTSLVLRQLPPVEDFVIGWTFPTYHREPELDPAALRKPGTRSKRVRLDEIVDLIFSSGEAKILSRVVDEICDSAECSRFRAKQIVQKAIAGGWIAEGGGLLWRKERTE